MNHMKPTRRPRTRAGRAGRAMMTLGLLTLVACAARVEVVHIPSIPAGLPEADRQIVARELRRAALDDITRLMPMAMNWSHVDVRGDGLTGRQRAYELTGVRRVSTSIGRDSPGPSSLSLPVYGWVLYAASYRWSQIGTMTVMTPGYGLAAVEHPVVFSSFLARPGLDRGFAVEFERKVEAIELAKAIYTVREANAALALRP